MRSDMDDKIVPYEIRVNALRKDAQSLILIATFFRCYGGAACRVNGEILSGTKSRINYI